MRAIPPPAGGTGIGAGVDTGAGTGAGGGAATGAGAAAAPAPDLVLLWPNIRESSYLISRPSEKKTIKFEELGLELAGPANIILLSPYITERYILLIIKKKLLKFKLLTLMLVL